MRYDQIKSMRSFYPVVPMCRTLEVSESSFHAWAIRPPSARKPENARLEIEVLAAHQRTRETYGAERLHSDMVDHSVHITPYPLRLLRSNTIKIAGGLTRSTL